MHHAVRGHENAVLDDARVELGAVGAPPGAVGVPLDMLERTFVHEREVTSGINELIDLAQSEQDHATNILLQ